jgi:hypothetical protein
MFFSHRAIWRKSSLVTLMSPTPQLAQLPSSIAFLCNMFAELSLLRKGNPCVVTASQALMCHRWQFNGPSSLPHGRSGNPVADTFRPSKFNRDQCSEYDFA